MISYAQNFEDVILWRVFRHIANGRYVDVGAFHPETDSVTKWFYDQGWSGINIEPVPSSFAILEAGRPRDRNIRAAAGAASGVAEMVVFPDSPGLSSLNPKLHNTGITNRQEIIEVDVWPLREILQPYCDEPIHFMKIDAEGSEREVLEGMNFVKFRPWVMVIEATSPMTTRRNSNEWSRILTNAGYCHTYFDGLNDFFVAEEKKDVAENLAIPPNVFDGFELARVVSLRGAFEGLRCEVSTLRDQFEADLQAHSSTIRALTSELTELTEALRRTRGRATALDYQIKEIQKQCTRLEEQCTRLEEQRNEVWEQKESLLRRAELAELQLQMVFRSRSWRWLAPFRDFKRAARSALGRSA
jgi:FkbM family methyltransferase